METKIAGIAIITDCYQSKQILKQRLLIREKLEPSNSTSAYLFQENQNTKLKRLTLIHPPTHCSIMHNSHSVEPT